MRICASSGEFIPSGGSVRCTCGRLWTNHDKSGEPQFVVPLHTSQRAVTAAKIRKELDIYFDASVSRKRVRETARRDSERKWARR